MDSLTLVQKIAVWALPLIFAIVFHEVAHGWVANRCGDPTARMLGRLSLNPVRHIDLFGTILLPVLMLSMSNFVFGWAKPVPVTFRNLRKPRRDKILVALAGPFANLLMALVWLGFLKINAMHMHSASAAMNPGFTQWALITGQIGVFINLVLMLLNLLPIPPLDGSRVISAALPGRWAYQYDRLEPYGMFILLGLLFSGILSRILQPMLHDAVSLLQWLAGL